MLKKLKHIAKETLLSPAPVSVAQVFSDNPKLDLSFRTTGYEERLNTVRTLQPAIASGDYNFADVRSFGNRNPDKVFYVIWLNGGSGFFSNISTIVCHLLLAKKLGMIPVIDCKNFKTLYNESTPINGTENMWEYYFQPIASYSLEDVYQSQNVVFGSGRYPIGFQQSLSRIEGVFESVFSEYIRVQKDIEAETEAFKQKITGKTLGVHFRGQEMKTTYGHPFPATENQMIHLTDELLERFQFEKIFMVTEEQSYLNLFIKRYGDIVTYRNSFRTYGLNAYTLDPRPNHRYLLGKEILIDSMILSKCQGLLGSNSNVTEFARVCSRKGYEIDYEIYNGMNSKNRFIARHAYAIRKQLPSWCGGFPQTIRIIDRNDGNVRTESI